MTAAPADVTATFDCRVAFAEELSALATGR